MKNQFPKKKKPTPGETNDEIMHKAMIEADKLKGLSQIGKKRAQFLSLKVDHNVWPKFVKIYAASSEKYGYSEREIDTVAPLARKLKLEIDSSWGQVDNYERLANNIFSNLFPNNEETFCETFCPNGVRAILVSWDHCRAPALLRALGCEDERCSRCWSDNNFETVIRLKFEDSFSDQFKTTFVPELPVGFIKMKSENNKTLSQSEGGLVDFHCAFSANVHDELGYFSCRYPDGTWLEN